MVEIEINSTLHNYDYVKGFSKKRVDVKKYRQQGHLLWFKYSSVILPFLRVLLVCIFIVDLFCAVGFCSSLWKFEVKNPPTILATSGALVSVQMVFFKVTASPLLICHNPRVGLLTVTSLLGFTQGNGIGNPPFFSDWCAPYIGRKPFISKSWAGRGLQNQSVNNAIFPRFCGDRL